MGSDIPSRKRNRLSNYDYSSCGAYFITVCTAERKNILWGKVGATIGRPFENELSLIGKITDTAINNISAIYPSLSVDSYVIMPNHIHLLVRVLADENGRPMVAPTMSRVVNHLKGYVSKQTGYAVWQKSFYDHVIRCREDYNEHIAYIADNPARLQYDELYSAE